MKIKITKRLPLIAAFTLISPTIAFAHNPGGKPDPMTASLEALKGAEFERSYLEQMIQHHRGGVEMAKLVGNHTKRPELREFADKMIQMQEQEITQMTRWLNDWYKASPKKVPNEKAGEEMKMYSSMLSAKHDDDFDKSFLEMMSKHHHGAVEMSELAESKSTHAELKEFAAKIAKDQEEEIKQLKSWDQSWFGPA